MRLSDVVLRARFPLVGFPAGWWPGSHTVAQVRSLNGEIRALQLLYETVEGDAGYLISHLAPEPAGRNDPLRLADHLAAFVAHFEGTGVAARMRRGKGAFPAGSFDEEDRVAVVCGQPSALRRLSHVRYPLVAARTALVANGRAVDLCIAGWHRDLDEAIPALHLLTAEAVRQFDAAVEASTGTDPLEF